MAARGQAMASQDPRGGIGEDGGGPRSGASPPSPMPPTEVAPRPWPVAVVEVPPKAQRRRFTAAFKRQILEAADQCETPGDVGALLRREGLYASNLHRWRKLREQGGLEGAVLPDRGPETTTNTPMARRLHDLQRDHAKLKRKLKQAEAIIELQKKVSEILGLTLAIPESDETS
jgi:transposase